MAALADVEHVVVGNDRTDVVVLAGGVGKRQQAVEPGYLRGVDLYGRNELVERLHQFVVKLCFEHQNLVFGAQNPENHTSVTQLVRYKLYHVSIVPVIVILHHPPGTVLIDHCST